MRMNNRSIVKKLLMGPVDWITLAPFLTGTTLGMGAWAVNMESGGAAAASVILILLSTGIYLNRLLFGWTANYEKAVAEGRESVEKGRDRELDALDLALRQDDDPRPENLLKDLRTLTKVLMSEQTQSLVVNTFDIVSDVDKLFQRSVDYLKESQALWQTAEQVERESIKVDLLKHRELLINEVEKSLENLGMVLGSIKKAAVGSRDGTQLAELREELTTRLKLAEAVEQQLMGLRGGSISVQDEAKYLQYADK